MTTTLLVLLVAAPLVAGLTAVALRGDPRRALVAAAAGATTALGFAVAGLAVLAVGAGPVQLGPADAPYLRLDGAGALLALVAALVATTVTWYARNHLDGDAQASRFATAASALLLGTVLLGTATTIQLAAASWVLASAATLGLSGYRRDEAARRVVRRALLPLVAADVAIVAAAVVATIAAAGSVRFDEATRELAGVELGGPLPMSVGALVVGLVALGALARAGQVPFRPWMTATVDVPTPVSALLHAGSVNAGGFLLVRSSDLLWQAPVVRLGLAACAAATMVLAAAGVRARPDVKGRLATSTAGQMGVMLLAAAIGAPAAVLTHLAGHSLYKSTRFLGAGEAIRRAVAARRAADGAGGVPATWVRVGSTGLAVGTAVATWLAIASTTEVAANEQGTTAALLTALVGTGAWAATSAPGLRGGATVLTVLAGAALLGAVAIVADTTLTVDHPVLAGGMATAFALLALTLAAVASLGRTAPLSGAALRWAAVPTARQPAELRRRVPAVVPAELGRSW